MLRSDRGAERARRCGANRTVSVGTTSGARRNAASGVELDVRGQVTGIVDGSAGGLAVFKGEFIGGSIDLAQVIDASIGLRGSTSLHEVRNRDRSQQTDDGHDDHDFNQGETRLTDVLVRFHFIFSKRGVNMRQADLDNYVCVHWIACCNHGETSSALGMPIVQRSFVNVQSQRKTPQKSRNSHEIERAMASVGFWENSP